MKSAKVFYKIAYLIVVIFVAVFTVGYAFAWFFERKDAEFAITGSSAGAYFESGNGSKETPFIISNPTHMHNLAVLQNMGKLDQKYYFQIKKSITSINMAGRYIPPIGNDEHPFIGDFDGNGKTLANLNVTTNKVLLADEYPAHAKATYEFSQAVGLFGMTGESSNIHNVILENPSVDVANSNTLYSSAQNAYAGLAVGFVAGKCSSIGVRALDAGSVLDVKKTGYSTFNSILGMLGDGVTSAVTGGGHGSGGSGNAFGSNFDVEGMYARLEKIEANKNSLTPAWRLPNLGDSSSTSITLDTLEKLPFTVDGAQSTYVGSDAGEIIAGNNIGYLLGNQNKVYSKSVKFGDPLTLNNGNYVYADGTTPAKNKIIPRWFYKNKTTYYGSDSYSTANITALTSEEFENLPDGIKEILPEANGQVDKFDSVRISQQYNNVGVQLYAGSDANGQWSPHGQISWMGKTYGEGVTMTNYKGDTYDENGYRYSSDGNKIDENGYLFNADGYFLNPEWPLSDNFDEEGYVIDADGERVLDFVGDPIKRDGYTLGNDDSGFYLIKEDGQPLLIDVGWGSNKKATPKTGTSVALYNYRNGVALPNNGIWFKPSMEGKIRLVMYSESANDGFTLIKGQRTTANKENPFIVDYSQSGKDIVTEEVAKCGLPSYVLFYFEYDITQEEIDEGNYEYWLIRNDGGGGGAYFVYMDLGASAADDMSGIDREKAVSAIDFIYDGVEIKQGVAGDDGATADDKVIGVGDFIVRPSGTTEELYNASKTSVYFENIKAVLNIVYIRLNEDPASNHSGKTICLEKSNPVPDTNSEVKATATRYVCPTIGSGGGGGGTVTPDPDPPTPENPTVSSVSVTPAAAMVKVGETANLSASVTMSDGSAYSGEIVWSSSDENTATVSGGFVTAKAAGSVTITATAGGKSASATITVEAALPVTNENLLSDIVTVTANSDMFGGNNALLGAKINGTPNKVSQSATCDEDGETFTDSLLPTGGGKTYTFTAKKKITLTVYFTVTDGSWASKTAAVTAKVGTTELFNQTITSAKGKAYKMTITLEEGDECAFTSSANRLAVFGIFVENG